ncbi:MAG: serine/threonine protein kinase [Candidatus Melainabacteria bacterium]|nr:serine/threonine protein kinase [Candidatus Melainabacteria bacterium]
MNTDEIDNRPPGTTSAALLPNTLVAGKYQITSQIGVGGMGTVYIARQIFLGKDFALKLLVGSDHSEVAVRRFQQEARTTALLSHPNLVEVHDFGFHENDQPFLVMDLVQGYTLARLLKRSGTLSLDYSIALALEVSQGLKYAHAQGVVHRDIKPSNIMLLRPDETPVSGTIKILDFGIAKVLQSEDGEMQQLTKTGEIFGSPIYVSPEQCQGEKVDRRTDIYSLGCVIFECLTGTPPFLGENAMSTMLKRVTENPTTLRDASLGLDFPAALEAIVRKMLERDTEKRYQNFDAVIKDFSQLQQDRESNRLTIAESGPVNKSKSKIQLPQLRDACIVAVTAVLSCAAMAVIDRQVLFREEFSTDNAMRMERKKQAELADKSSAEGLFIDYKGVLKYPTRDFRGEGNNKQEVLHFPSKVGEIRVGEEKQWRPAFGDIQTGGKLVDLSFDEEAGSDPEILRNLSEVNFGEISFPGKYRVTNETLIEIGNIKQLKGLDVDGGDVSSIEPIAHTKLADLRVGETRLQSNELLKFDHLQDLESITFGPVDDPASVLSKLAQGKTLRVLHYKGALPSENEAKLWRELNNLDVDIIAQMPNLEALMIQNCSQIDDNCIKKLSSMKSLRRLIIKDCVAVTSKSIPTFKKMIGLKTLIITAKNWPAADFDRLKNLPYEVKIDALRQEKTNKSQKKIFDVAKSFDLNDPTLPP